jgi:Na+/H+-dicarboxylate symporter
MFFGVALAALGDLGRALTTVIDALAHVMLKITGYVMLLAPVAVFAAIAATVATNGLEILLKFAVFMGDFYIGLIILWGLLVFADFVFLGKRVFRLIGLIKEPFLLSFATASSEAAYPKILDSLDRFGVQRKISSFVLPMGYSFNLDGSMMYCTFATLFIAQAYNIHSADRDAADNDGHPDADVQRDGRRAAHRSSSSRRRSTSSIFPRPGCC